jgi:hypothetical protein
MVGSRLLPMPFAASGVRGISVEALQASDQ